MFQAINLATPAKVETFTTQEIIRNSSTNRICDMFELCACIVNVEAPTVRSWLMDELSRRYPQKVAAWDSLPEKSDADLRRIIAGTMPAVSC